MISEALHSMTGMIFAASVSLCLTTAFTKATTALQQSSRFAGPAFTDAVPKIVTTPALIEIAARPILDLMCEAGSRPNHIVSMYLGASLGRL